MGGAAATVVVLACQLALGVSGSPGLAGGCDWVAEGQSRLIVDNCPEASSCHFGSNAPAVHMGMPAGACSCLVHLQA